MKRLIALSYRSAVLRAVIGVAAFVVLRASALAQWASPPIINPQTYHSSGPYALFINPEDPYGQGLGSYQLKKNGVKQWTETLPFTLRYATVTANGTVAGYAYSSGWSGLDNSVPRHGDGQVDIVILDNHGRIRLHQVMPRRYGNYPEAPLFPIVNGFIADETYDRLIVRLNTLDAASTASGEEWWLYRLSTGQSIGHVVPSTLFGKSSDADWIIDAQAIRGTPLLLVQFWLVDDRDNLGTRFCLFDLQDRAGTSQPHATLVWSLNLPQDYNLPGLGSEARDQIQDSLRNNGTILGNGSIVVVKVNSKHVRTAPVLLPLSKLPSYSSWLFSLR